MRTVDIEDAMKELERWVDEASRGEVIVLAKAGQPVAQLGPLEAAQTFARLGFYAGMPAVPDDFDEWASDEIADLFGAGDFARD